MKRKFLLVPFLSLLLAGCGSQTSSQPIVNPDDSGDNTGTASEWSTFTVKDALNRTVEIASNPQSFVCIGPGCLRQYCYVGDTSKIVGIENYEKKSAPNTRPYINTVPNYMDLPVIGEGGPKDVTNTEALLMLQPDVVFTSYVKDPKSVDALAEKTGLAVVAVGYNSDGLFAQDIYDSLKLIGKVTHREQRALDVVNYFENCKKELVEKANVKPANTRAYLGAVNHKGSHGIDYTTGSFPIFDILNVKNVVNEKGVTDFAQIDKEILFELQPELIILDAGGLPLVKQDMIDYPDYYESINAFKNHNVYVQMPFVFYSNNFDVALADAYYIASIVYPEQFENFDIKTKFNEISQYLLGIDSYDSITEKFGHYGQFEYTL